MSRLLWGLLLFALPASAQVKVGQNLSFNMTGGVGFGYNGDYGNVGGSDHGTGINGDANISGYYYNPNFLNFYVTPVYDRSQANSGEGSIIGTTSVGAGVGIFSGSHFPGTVTFGKNFNGSSSFGLPNMTGFTTSGESTQFGIGWSELLPNLPPVQVNYFQDSSSSTFLGTEPNENDRSSTRSFSLQSQYRLAGWSLNGRFLDLWTHTQLPSFLTTGEEDTTAQNSRTFSFTTNHALPLHGSVAFGYGYSSFDGNGDGTTTSGSNNDFSGNATFAPLNRLTTLFGAQYNTSLQGEVEQQLITAGSVAPQVNFGSNSSSLSLYNYDILNIGKGLGVAFNFNRTQQEIYGQSVASNQFGVILDYRFNKPLWGMFYFYAGVNDQSTQDGHQGTGAVGGVNFTRKVSAFELNGSFSYAQNVQTVLATEVTSNYSYLANVRRELSHHLRWYANFNGYHSGASLVAGSSAHSEGYGTNLMYRGYGGGFTYTNSYGTALLTGSGLVSTPITALPVLNPNQYLLENSSSYTIVGSATPINRWTMNVNYSKAMYDTTTPALYSSNWSKVLTAYTTCQFRQMSIGGGYTLLMQSVGAGSTGALPASFSSFYVGIQRWFKPF
ncbi:MAG: hypothetical protein WCF26_19405 [Candidatus Sulfotelmatobacter sp.]